MGSRPMFVPEIRPGDVLGGYRLEIAVGEGAMGLVFRAVRERDGAVVALKVLKVDLSGDDEFRKRFRREAMAAAEVHDPHLVPIVEFGEAEGRQFLAAQYVEGRTLEERLEAEGALPLDELVRLVEHVAGGLDALHAAEVVHRDIKPSNIILKPDGTAVLTDFGLAKGRAYTALTRPGHVMGTLDYLAPELIRGQPATPATDVYALGGVAYECAVGKPPFAAKSVFEVGVAHLEEEPPDCRQLRPELSERFVRALLAALAKDPEARPPSPGAYAASLRAAVDE